MDVSKKGVLQRNRPSCYCSQRADHDLTKLVFSIFFRFLKYSLQVTSTTLDELRVSRCSNYIAPPARARGSERSHPNLNSKERDENSWVRPTRPPCECVTP